MGSCPVCSGDLFVTDDGYTQCRPCGAYKDTSAVSGHTIWMRHGRVLLAVQDTEDAIRKAATEFPEAFEAAAKKDPAIAAALKE